MWQFGVPNAPCGVERQNCSIVLQLQPDVFLMHRVELKEVCVKPLCTPEVLVPNAPCGVERKGFYHFHCQAVWFLMHRVELKVSA